MLAQQTNSTIFEKLTGGGGPRKKLGLQPYWNVWNSRQYHKVVMNIVVTTAKSVKFFAYTVFLATSHAFNLNSFKVGLHSHQNKNYAKFCFYTYLKLIGVDIFLSSLPRQCCMQGSMNIISKFNQNCSAKTYLPKCLLYNNNIRNYALIQLCCNALHSNGAASQVCFQIFLCLSGYQKIGGVSSLDQFAVCYVILTGTLLLKVFNQTVSVRHCLQNQ